MTHDFFSTAQMFGHATLILSMVTFSRKRDAHFKLCLTFQRQQHVITIRLLLFLNLIWPHYRNEFYKYTFNLVGQNDVFNDKTCLFATQSVCG